MLQELILRVIIDGTTCHKPFLKRMQGTFPENDLATISTIKVYGIHRENLTVPWKSAPISLGGVGRQGETENIHLIVYRHWVLQKSCLTSEAGSLKS